MFVVEASRYTVDAKRSLFNAVVKKQLQTDQEKRDILYRGLKDVLPGSCFVVLNDAKQSEESRSVSNNIDSDAAHVPTLSTSNLENITLRQAKAASTVEEFLDSLVPISDEVVNIIEVATVGQSDNEVWHTQCKGRITASNFLECSLEWKQ